MKRPRKYARLRRRVHWVIGKLRAGLFIGVMPFAFLAMLVLVIWQKLDSFDRE